MAGGAGVMMDVRTGEIIAMTSYPEYDSNIMSDGKNRTKINEYLQSKNTPFLDRASDGLYTPGSIVKPYMALAALAEKVIDPSKQILSTGSIAIQKKSDPPKLKTFEKQAIFMVSKQKKIFLGVNFSSSLHHFFEKKKVHAHLASFSPNLYILV
jgi:cell division protein FtsI/penicillin-binding protein 2